jgi:hypothetical protein
MFTWLYPAASLRTGNTAVYVTLIVDAEPIEVDLWKDHLHTWVLRLLVAPQPIRRVANLARARLHCHRSLPRMAQWHW